MPRSRYDELHDFYGVLLTNKSGTRYERLAAVVFAAMERDGIVSHDLVVRGTVSGVGHQIDVVVEKGGALRRVLVECKDFDVSGDPVGLGIVRDFYGTVSDVRPDEAWILTCNYFTRDARRYAKAMGIRLATLREFASKDWESRIHTVAASLNVQHVRTDQTRVSLKISDADLTSIQSEGSIASLLSATADHPVLVSNGDSVLVYPVKRIVL